MALALERRPSPHGRKAKAAAPYLNRAVILACVLAFVLRLPPETFAFVPAYVFGTVDLAGPLPTAALWCGLFGHVFIHADPTHLVSNMVVLLALGDVVESDLGHRRYLILFLSGSVAGALAEGVIATDRMAPLVGSSGAICALMGAVLWLRPLHGPMARRWLRRLVKGVIVAFALLNAALALIPLPTMPPEMADVGWGAHTGGFLVGLALGPLMRHRGSRGPA